MLVPETETSRKRVLQDKSTGDAQLIELVVDGKSYTVRKPWWWGKEAQFEQERRRREARAARKKERGGTCPKPLRQRVLKAFGYACQYCGKGDYHDSPFLHVDRMIPGSQGGQYVPENVTLACINCNSNRNGVIAPVYGPVRPLSAVEVTS